MDQKKKITIDFDNQPMAKEPMTGEVHRLDRKELEKESTPKKIVITKETKLGDAWLHKSQDLMSEVELDESRKKIED